MGKRNSKGKEGSIPQLRISKNEERRKRWRNEETPENSEEFLKSTNKKMTKIIIYRAQQSIEIERSFSA